MSAPVACPSPTSEPGKTHPVWMDMIPLSRFALNRVLYLLVVPPAILGVSMHFGQGVLGLVLMAVAFWPFAFRLRTSPEGLQISWLLFRERTRWDEIRSARLALDDRKLVVGRRKQVLVLERYGRRALTLRASSRVLSEIAREIAPHLGPERTGEAGA
jgi:hypothetical protein